MKPKDELGIKSPSPEWMRETKICETCKHEAKEPLQDPCANCSKASYWESRQGGCDFCNGSEVKDRGFIFSIDKDNDLEAYHYDESLFGYLSIKFCPICGKKL